MREGKDLKYHNTNTIFENCFSWHSLCKQDKYSKGEIGRI